VVGVPPTPPASIVIEIGAEQGDAATELVRQAGYGQVEVRRDLAGHDRAVIGR
jgi:release factor glutamine methyltransferase